MWFSSNRPVRPQRRVSHATVLACVALVVAALGIPATAVATTALVPRNSVGTAQLRNGAVTNPKIANNAVGPARIRDSAVTNPKLANNAVGPAKIRDNAVTNPKLANNAVGTAKMRDRAVTGAKVGVRTLTGDNINLATLPGASTTFIRRNGGGTVGYQQPAHTVDAIYGSWFASRSFAEVGGCDFPVLSLHVNLEPHDHLDVAEAQLVGHFNAGTGDAFAGGALQSTAELFELTNRTGNSVRRELRVHAWAKCLGTGNAGPANVQFVHLFIVHIPAQR